VKNLGSHGLVQKGSDNDESIRISLIMAGPGMAAQARVKDSVASLVDLMPTLLGAAGQAMPTHCQGSSLSGEGGGAAPSNRTAFVETVRSAGLRSANMTYVLKRDGDGRLSKQPIVAYDNSYDPFQYNNVAGTRTCPELDAKLRAFDKAYPWSRLEDEVQ